MDYYHLIKAFLLKTEQFDFLRLYQTACITEELAYSKCLKLLIKLYGARATSMLGKLRENVFLYYTFLAEIPLAWENILDFFLQANLLSQ